MIRLPHVNLETATAITNRAVFMEMCLRSFPQPERPFRIQLSIRTVRDSRFFA